MSTSEFIASECRGWESLTTKIRRKRCRVQSLCRCANYPLQIDVNENKNIDVKCKQSTSKEITCLEENFELIHNLNFVRSKTRNNTRRSCPYKSRNNIIFVTLCTFLLYFVSQTTAKSSPHKIPLIKTDATEEIEFKKSVEDELDFDSVTTMRSVFGETPNTVSVANLDFQTMKYIKEWGDDVKDVLLISGKDYVFMVNNTISKNADRIKVVEKLKWKSDKDLRTECEHMGKITHECQNFIRVVELMDDDTLLVCGTNAYSPKCRTYTRAGFHSKHGNNSDHILEEICRGKECPVPYSPTSSSATLYTSTTHGKQLFSALTHDWNGEIPVISRRNKISSASDVYTNPNVLEKPKFIKILEYKDKVYVFFTETVVEVDSSTGEEKEETYAKVAQVCKDDTGGEGVLFQLWTTFLKARLKCSGPSLHSGSHSVQFKNLTSVSDIVTIAGEDGNPMDVVFATFTVPWDWNEIGASGICMFPMGSAIQSVFENGRFLKEVKVNTIPQEGSEPAFLASAQTQHKTIKQVYPVHPSAVPVPRPGSCDKNYPQQTLITAQKFTQIYDPVQPFYNKPIFVTETNVRLIQIAVDNNAGGRGYIMLYLGTEDGKLLKIRTRLGMEEADGPKAVLLEESRLVPEKECHNDNCGVRQIHLARDEEGLSAFVAFTDYYVHFPVMNCEKIATKDCCQLFPDCGWKRSDEGGCVARTTRNLLSLYSTTKDERKWPVKCSVVPIEPIGNLPSSDSPQSSSQCNCENIPETKAPCQEKLKSLDDDIYDIPGLGILDYEDTDVGTPGTKIMHKENSNDELNEVFTNRILPQVAEQFSDTLSSLNDQQKESLKQQLEDVMVSTANLVLANHRQEYCLPTPTVNHLTHVYPLLLREIEIWHQTAIKKMTAQGFSPRCWTQNKYKQPCTLKVTFSIPLVHILWEPLSKLIADFMGECRSIERETTGINNPLSDSDRPKPGCKTLIGLQSCKDARSQLPHCQPKLCTFPKYAIDVKAFFRHANDSRQFLDNSEDVEPLWKPVNVTLSETESIRGHLEVYVKDQPFTIDYSPVAEKVKISFRYAAIRDCSLSEPGCAGSGTRCNPSVEQAMRQWHQKVMRKMTPKMRECTRELKKEEKIRSKRDGYFNSHMLRDRSELSTLHTRRMIVPNTITTRCKRLSVRVHAPPLEVWKNIVTRAKRAGGIYRETSEFSAIEFYSHQDVVQFFKNMCSFEETQWANLTKRVTKRERGFSLIQLMARENAPFVLKRHKGGRNTTTTITYFVHKPT